MRLSAVYPRPNPPPKFHGSAQNRLGIDYRCSNIARYRANKRGFGAGKQWRMPSYGRFCAPEIQEASTRTEFPRPSVTNSQDVTDTKNSKS